MNLGPFDRLAFDDGFAGRITPVVDVATVRPLRPDPSVAIVKPTAGRAVVSTATVKRLSPEPSVARVTP